MEPEGSFLQSKLLATCSYPKSYHSSPCPNPNSRRSILISSSHLHPRLPGCLLPSRFPHQDPLCTSYLPARVLHTQPITFFSIWLDDLSLVRSNRSWRIWLCSFLTKYGGRDSSVSIATSYELDGPGNESRCGARFSAPVQKMLWGPHRLLYNGYRVSTGAKAAEAWCWPPRWSSVPRS